MGLRSVAFAKKGRGRHMPRERSLTGRPHWDRVRPPRLYRRVRALKQAHLLEAVCGLSMGLMDIREGGRWVVHWGVEGPGCRAVVPLGRGLAGMGLVGAGREVASGRDCDGAWGLDATVVAGDVRVGLRDPSGAGSAVGAGEPGEPASDCRIYGGRGAEAGSLAGPPLARGLLQPWERAEGQRVPQSDRTEHNT